ncbi:MAG TPA: glycosyltransferase family 2 protein [Puia sp.]|nr:glycosyltransferase family 2 protein [Puia sp.]
MYRIIFLYFAFSVVYLFVLSVWGRLFYRRSATGNGAGSGPGRRRIALLVPAYKEDGIILSTAESLLSLDYPRHLFDVFIIADSFKPETLVTLRSLQVNVIEVSFEKSTKTKSLNEAFRRIGEPYDIALICDADNILAADFLQRIDGAFSAGARAVQGCRVAKNLDSPFAILDACSEAINNHIFRRGSNAIGLSSAVIGSGMAFEYGMVRDILSRIDAVGGFDKILQLEIVRQGISIRYLADALVFDEKVSTSAAFQQQRKRWVSSQYIYFRRFFLPACLQLVKGNVSYFNLAVLCNVVLPRAFLLAVLPLFAASSFILGVTPGLAATGLWLLYMLTLALALPAGLINRDFWRAILRLPRAVGLMLGTLFQVKKANKTFIHTVHTKTEVTNYLFTENKHKNG